MGGNTRHLFLHLRDEVVIKIAYPGLEKAMKSIKYYAKELIHLLNIRKAIQIERQLANYTIEQLKKAGVDFIKSESFFTHPHNNLCYCFFSLCFFTLNILSFFYPISSFAILLILLLSFVLWIIQSRYNLFVFFPKMISQNVLAYVGDILSKKKIFVLCSFSPMKKSPITSYHIHYFLMQRFSQLPVLLKNPILYLYIIFVIQIILLSFRFFAAIMENTELLTLRLLILQIITLLMLVLIILFFIQWLFTNQYHSTSTGIVPISFMLSLASEIVSQNEKYNHCIVFLFTGAQNYHPSGGEIFIKNNKSLVQPTPESLFINLHYFEKGDLTLLDSECSDFAMIHDYDTGFIQMIQQSYQAFIKSAKSTGISEKISQVDSPNPTSALPFLKNGIRGATLSVMENPSPKPYDNKVLTVEDIPFSQLEIYKNFLIDFIKSQN